MVTIQAERIVEMRARGKKNQEGETLNILAEDSLQNETRKDQIQTQLTLGLG